MDSLQDLLSEYLQCELCHTLGSYRVAYERLDGLAERLRDEHGAQLPADYHDKSEQCGNADHLLYLAKVESEYNSELGRHRHASPPQLDHERMAAGESSAKTWPVRDPIPEGMPLTRGKRFNPVKHNKEVEHDRVHRWHDSHNWDRIPKFYSQAIDALCVYDRSASPRPGDEDWYRHRFAESLIAQRDGAPGAWSDRAWLERRRRRIDRYQRRREQAHEWLSPEGRNDRGHASGLRGRVGRVWRGSLAALADESSTLATGDLADGYPVSRDFLVEIATSNLGEGKPEHSLPLFVIRAQAEAHLSMHAVEAWQSMCLGEHAELVGSGEREWLADELDQSIALSTFAYCVSRTAPWIFAEHDAESQRVFDDYVLAWENLVPAQCMWIAAQIGLLALHRRAYARCLKGDTIESYNDYHKLQRLIRDTERRVHAAPIHVEGALEFLAGLDAEAHHHIGELYRSQHAHRPALEHFEAASHRMERLRKADRAKAVLTNSRWYVLLQISRGKASYEMGRHKQALSWHLHAWRAFLELVAADTRSETSTTAIEDAIAWLERVKFEPELRKSEVAERLGPVVVQLDRITVIDRFGALAAEILLRLGHLLFVLNVGYDRSDRAAVVTKDTTPAAAMAWSRVARDQVKRTLAFACLRKAAECDPHSTLVGADLLKARYRFNNWLRGELGTDYAEQLEAPDLAPIDEQWPRGGDDYEQLARVAEYLMLKERMGRFEDSPPDGGTECATDGFVARDLLLSLFMSTDSINVRKSQIHRFLMKPESGDPAPIVGSGPAIELVCMRRYSSPFPLLPRPSAFRALGGGYFVRLHSQLGDSQVTHEAAGADQSRRDGYGIVVDPGVDFVESLYRTGYSLSDVHMIVLTHDHVDHLGALDPLLSLIHVRADLLKKQEGFDESGKETRKVRVLVSRSVYQRYGQVTRLINPTQVDPDSREFEFACFEGMADENGVVDPANPFFADFPRGFEIIVMSSTAGQGEKGGHFDLSNLPSHGLCFRTRDGGGASVALTSDTPCPPPSSQKERYEQWRRVWKPAIEADVLVVHLGSVPLTELRRIDQQGQVALWEHSERPERSGNSNGEALARDESSLKRIQEQLQGAEERLRGQIEYAQWLRSHGGESSAGLVGPVPERWSPPDDHNYLEGMLRWAREYRAVHAPTQVAPGESGSGGERRRAGLFVVGELSEELGTMRNKIASRLNEWIFNVPKHRRRLAESELDSDLCHEGTNEFPYALTADIGLHVCVCAAASSPVESSTCTKVLCTTCDLDTDRSPNERYHIAHDVYEVCVKGENEGIFYNCLEHDPARQEDPAFLEQLERFDIFGR